MNLCARRETEGEGDIATSWYTSGRTWRKMEDNGIGNKELLVAKSYKGSKNIYR